jgi:arginyl-tRNA synthetase
VFRDDEKKRIRKLGKMTILRSDGTSLYQTKELGLAKHKFDNFEIDESLYVVGAEQRLYFQQVFAILRLWGFPNAENCRHIAYELVVLPEGKMSSREGTIVSYRALRDEAIRRAEKITREKGIAGNIHQTARVIAYIHQTARVIAIAAIKYTMLQISGNQQIVFDFEQALSFSGRAAPYLQYAYARAGKLVGDSAAPPRDAPSYELHPSEVELARVISEYPEVCANAAEQYEPALVCNYLYELANAFSAFYRDCRVLDAPAEEQAHRQALVAAFRTVLASGFRVLALPLPEEM